MISLMAAFVASSPAEAGLITVKSDDCPAQITHVPDDDVAYKPDSDSRGNSVLPADVNNPGRVDYNADDIVITIGHPLIAVDGDIGDQETFVAEGGEIRSYGADLEVGQVTMNDGEVYFNDQRLTDNERRVCAEKQ